MIIPTVGRVVHFFPSEALRARKDLGFGPLAAIVAHVHHEYLINVGVFSPNGHVFAVQDVPLLQDGDVAREGEGYCAWMDYQKGQAAKYDALAAQQATATTPVEAEAPALTATTGAPAAAAQATAAPEQPAPVQPPASEPAAAPEPQAAPQQPAPQPAGQPA